MFSFSVNHRILFFVGQQTSQASWLRFMVQLVPWLRQGCAPRPIHQSRVKSARVAPYGENCIFVSSCHAMDYILSGDDPDIFGLSNNVPPGELGDFSASASLTG